MASIFIPTRITTFTVTIFVLLMGFYGLLAVDAGQRLVVESTFVDRDALQASRVAIRSDATQGKPINITQQPLWTRLTSALTSQKHMYGRDSYFDTHVYLAQMPDLDAMVLGLHAALAGICMVFGALQFVPGVRKRFPRWHRRLGLIFVVFGLIAMLLSVVYLIRTPPTDTYGGLTFYLGLWLLAIAVSGALCMAMFHILRRDISQHQVYMALAYGLMLTAPLLRYDWIGLGVFLHDELSFNEINYAVNVFLIPQSYLLGYLLVLFNRGYPRAFVPTSRSNASVSSNRFLNLWVTAATLFGLACVATIGRYYRGNLNAASDIFDVMVPTSVWANHLLVIDGSVVLQWLFILASGVVFLTFPVLLRAIYGKPSEVDTGSRLASGAAWIFAVASVVVGAVQLCWAWQLGLPSHETASAGAGNLIGGTACLLLGIGMCWACRCRALALFKEWAVFSVLFAASPVAFLWTLRALWQYGLPQIYVDQSHAYTVASAAGPGLAMFAFLYVTYGEANRRTYGQAQRGERTNPCKAPGRTS